MLFRGFYFHHTGVAIKFVGEDPGKNDPKAGESSDFSDGIAPATPPHSPWSPSESDVSVSGKFKKTRDEAASPGADNYS